MSRTALICNAAVVVAMLVAYVVVTLAHMDGTPLLYLLAGQATGVVTTKTAEVVESNGKS